MKLFPIIEKKSRENFQAHKINTDISQIFIRCSDLDT